MRNIAVVFMACVAFILVVGCATTPKDYKESHGEESITADIASQKIGDNTTFGIVNAVIGVFAGFYTFEQYNAYSDAYDAGNSELANKYSNNSSLGLLTTLVLIGGSAKSFKTSREWESELRKIERTSSNWPLEKSWSITESASFDIRYNPINFNSNDSLNNYREMNTLSFGLNSRF